MSGLDGVNNLNSLNSIGSNPLGNSSTSVSDSSVPVVAKFDPLKYLIAQGYTAEEAQKLIKEHPELTTGEQWTNYTQSLKIVDNNNIVKTPLNNDTDFEEFSKSDLKTKFDILTEEYAKNQNIKNWDKMSDKEKQTAKESAINSLIERINKSSDKKLTFEQIKESINNPENIKKLSPAKKAVVENIMSDLLLDMRVADKMELTIEDFYKLDETDQTIVNSRKYEYIDDLKKNDINSYNALSNEAKQFYENETITVEAFQAKYKNIDANPTPADISQMIEDINSGITDDSKKINRASVVYEYLSEKVSKGEELNESEKILYEHYKKFADSGRPPLNKVSDFDATNKTFRKMAKDEIYQNAVLEAKKKGIENPENHAIKVYVENLLGNASTDDERKAIIKELFSGTSLSGREELTKIFDKLRKEKLNSLHDTNGKLKISTLYDYNDLAIRGADVDAEDLELAYKDNIFSQETHKDVGTFVETAYAKAGESKIDDLKKVRRFSESDDKIVTDAMKTSGWSESAIKNVGDDFTDNFALYKQEARISHTRQHGYWYQNKADAIEAANKLQQVIIEHNNDPGIGDVYEAYGGSTSSYIPEAQVTVANNVMSMAEHFSDEQNIRAQSALANDVQNCDVKNQLEIHSTIMNNSKYDEVLELASSNIHNYDESVQADAIRVTYATGNENAIRACEGQLDQCKGVNASEYSYSNYLENKNSVNTIRDAINNLDLSKSEDKQKFLDLVEKNSSDVSKYLASCSEKDKANFVEKYCNLASESQLIAFVKNNPSMCGLVMRYSNGLNKEKLFGVIYNGNKGAISKILNQLNIKGNNIINLARTYKEIASDIALETENSALARLIITNPNEWGYQLGRPETKKLQELASKKQILENTETKPETAHTLRNKELFPTDRLGFLRA